MTNPTDPRPGFPVSPCIDICSLDENDVCQGCLRSLQEVIDWSRLSAAEQWAVVNDLPARRRLRQGPGRVQ
ncbi:MAG: DUF1289 domain-containing protein [Gammaproteobacteria bacterium]|nr:DUF1289 domain-containing protein [Gammaproteobacteria bacterium]